MVELQPWVDVYDCCKPSVVDVDEYESYVFRERDQRALLRLVAAELCDVEFGVEESVPVTSYIVETTLEASDEIKPTSVALGILVQLVFVALGIIELRFVALYDVMLTLLALDGMNSAFE